MPFCPAVPRLFTAPSIQEHAPHRSGVYGISNAREWIYIGVADDIQQSLIGHLQTPHTPLLRREPTGFVFELCDREARAVRQDRLVLEYEPACNRRA